MKFFLLMGKDATWDEAQEKELAEREELQQELYLAHEDCRMHDNVRRLYMAEDRQKEISRWDCMLDCLKDLRRLDIQTAMLG